MVATTSRSAGHLGLEGQMVLHLVEAHGALVREQLPALVDGLLGLEAGGEHLFGDPAPQRGEARRPVAQALQMHEGVRIGVRTARDATGSVVSSAVITAAMPVNGSDEELDVPMGLLQRRPGLDHLVERPRLDAFLDARELRVLQRHLRQHAERPEADARGVEERAVARGAAIEDPVIRGRDAEPDHAAVQRLEAPPGAVRPGRERTGERLLVDVGKVRHLLADRGERRADVAEARPGPKRRPQLGRVVRDETGHDRRA